MEDPSVDTTPITITRSEAVFCNPESLAKDQRMHAYIYLKSEKSYKCTLCGYRIKKEYLKELTD